MNTPLDIVVHNIEKTESIEQRIKRNAEKLPLYYDRIEFCKVAVDVPQNHKQQGKEFQVRIELGVPHQRLVINRVRGDNLYVTIRKAFSAMKRKLESYVQKQKRQTKQHPLALKGWVSRLYADYGFIVAPDKQEYYFNASHLLHPAFDDLEIGMWMYFSESVSDDGLQAVHVRQME